MEAACGARFADSYLSGAVEGPGSLIPKTMLAYDRLRMRVDAMRVLKSLDIELIKPAKWMPHPERTDLTDAEYAYLTLPEKMRHHQMCAMEAEMRAGPMWRRGHPVSRADLSAKWHENHEIAQHHHAEAGRIRKIIAEAPK